MKKLLTALLLLLVLLLPTACEDEETAGEAADTEEAEEDVENGGEENAVAEDEAPFAVGDTVWATYYNPEQVSALTWEKTEVLEVGEETVTVEFGGFLNEGETDERAFEWVYPYVEAWSPDEVEVGTTVVVNPEGFSDDVNYPGEVTAIEDGMYTVAWETDGAPRDAEFTLEELH
ncbi:MAG: hypothetical protein GF399_06550 [Candidatus Coatesbacteria bacterium]|nr:hypothetical protein [Candidatus Coatesbacteria bacterium]